MVLRAALAACFLGISLVAVALWYSGEDPPAPILVPASDFATWSKQLERGGEVAFVRQPVDGAQATCNSPMIVSSLGPLSADLEADVRRLRLHGPLQSHTESLHELLSRENPPDEVEALKLFERILSLHHSINAYRAAVAGFDSGEYWVMKPGSQDPSIEGLTYIKVCGIKVPNNDNVDVVIPIRLAERPDVAASGSELERTRRYIMECEARAFNAEPDDVRKARFVAHDAATAEADRLWDLAKKAKADNDNAAYVNLLEQKGAADRRRIGVLFLLDRTNFTISPVHLHR